VGTDDDQVTWDHAGITKLLEKIAVTRS